MKKFYFMIFILIAFINVSTILSNNLNWEKLMLPGNIIRSNKLDKIIYSQKDTIIYKSTDYGKTWNFFCNFNYSCSCIIKINNVYMIGTNKGIFSSSNEGNKWNQYLIGNSISDLSYSNNGIIIATTIYYIYSSTDLGLNWVQVMKGSSQLSNFNLLNCDYQRFIVRYHYDSPGSHYYGLLSSTDHGKTWGGVFNNLAYPATVTTYCFSYDSILYIHATDGYFYHTKDFGNTWSSSYNIKFGNLNSFTIDNYYTFFFISSSGDLYLSLDTCKTLKGENINNNNILGIYRYSSNNIIIQTDSGFYRGYYIKLLPPTNLASTPEDHQIKLNWEASPTQGVKYNIYRRIKGTPDWLQQNGGNAIDGLEYIDNLADHYVLYEYTVKAYDPVNQKESDNSNIVEARWISDDYKKLFLELDNLSDILDKLENLTTDKDFDAIQKLFLNDLKKIMDLGNYRSGYDVKIGRDLISEWKDKIPTEPQKATEAIRRLDNFLEQILVNLYYKGQSQYPGITEVSSEASYGIAAIVENITTILWVIINDYQKASDDEFLMRLFNETIRYCLNEALELAKTGDTEKETVNCLMALATVYETSGSGNGIEFGKEVGENILTSISNVIVPYYFTNQGLSAYINQSQGVFQRSIFYAKNKDFEGSESEAGQKCNTRVDTVHAIANNYKNQYGTLEGLCKVVNYSNEITSGLSPNKMIEIQKNLATQLPQILAKAILIEQRNNFLYGGPLATYYWDFDFLHPKHQSMPVLIDRALGASFHPTLYKVKEKDNLNDNILLKSGDNLLVNVDTSAFVDEINYVTNIQTHLQNSNKDYIYKNIDSTQQRGFRFMEMINKIIEPIKGIPASIVASDSNLSKQISGLYEKVSLIKGYRSLVTTSQILYCYDSSNVSRLIAISQIDTFLLSLQSLFNQVDNFLDDNSKYISNPAFYIISANAIQTSDNDVYDVKYYIKNVGASLSGNGKIIAYLFADSVKIISSDTINLQSFNTQEEKFFTTKSFLKSNTGKVNIITEFIVNDTLLNRDNTRFDIPKSIVGVIEDSKKVVSSIFQVYPNPVNNSVSISNNLWTTIENLEIFNLYSQKVYSGEISGSEMQIDVSTFPTGVYFVVIGNQRQMFIKN